MSAGYLAVQPNNSQKMYASTAVNNDSAAFVGPVLLLQQEYLQSGIW
jgi:hypothetical protein